jgi:circadian clock protein KaiB
MAPNLDLLKKVPSGARGLDDITNGELPKERPLPVRRLLGDLSNTEKVLLGLDLRKRRD